MSHLHRLLERQSYPVARLALVCCCKSFDVTAQPVGQAETHAAIHRHARQRRTSLDTAQVSEHDGLTMANTMNKATETQAELDELAKNAGYSSFRSAKALLGDSAEETLRDFAKWLRRN